MLCLCQAFSDFQWSPNWEPTAPCRLKQRCLSILDASALRTPPCRVDWAEKTHYLSRRMSSVQRDFQRPHGSSSRLWTYVRSAVGVLVIAWVATGCALGRRDARHLDVSEGRLLARPPDFLTGPVSVLLTNQDDFSAHLVVASARGSWQNVWPVSGNLFHQQGRLLFVPMPDESSPKSPWAGSFRFLWDVRSNSGFVLSEPLKAFAPASSSARFVPGLVGDNRNVGTAQIDDQLCQVGEATVTATKGVASDWRLWRASDLGNVPLRLASLPDTNDFRIELSQVQVQVQVPDLFQPPADFVEYRSVDALVSSLLHIQRRPPPPDVSGRHGR
jgi:hypothetical protein